MAELDQNALDAAEHRGQYILPRELLKFVERHDETVEGGVPLERLEEYAAALDERGVQSMDPDSLDELIEKNLTDEESWVGPDAVYRVGDGFSAFPARWHDELAGEDDLVTYVDDISGDLASEEKHTATGGAGTGVPEKLLLDTVSALGPFSRDGAKSELERLRNEGALEERTSQHPESRVWPTHE